MIRAWLRYLIWLLLGSGLYVFYVGYISYFIFLLVISLPMVSFLLYCIAMWRFEMTIHSPSTKLYKGKTQEISLRSCTKTWIPIAKIEASLHIQNHFHTSITEETLTFTSEHDESDVFIPYEFSMCGKYTIEVRYVYIYDILHLFRRKKKCSSSLSIFVLPMPIALQEELSFSSHLGDEEFDANRAGNDPQETFDVHAYRDGDSLHKVHWKLSAKLNTIMVKESSVPIAKHMKLCFDLYGSSLDADTILGQLVGCSTYLLHNQHEHDILQYEEGICVRQVHITNTDELTGFLCEVISKPANMSATSYVQKLALHEDTILIQKNHIITQMSKGGEQHETSK